MNKIFKVQYFQIPKSIMTQILELIDLRMYLLYLMMNVCKLKVDVEGEDLHIFST